MTHENLVGQLEQATAAERRGQFDTACQLLRNIIDQHDESTALDARLRLGRLLVFRGRAFIDQAEEVLGRAYQFAEQHGLPRQQARALHLRALLERQRGNFDLATTMLESSPVLRDTAAIGPEKGQWHHYRGLLEADRANHANAERQYFYAHRAYQEADYEPGMSEVCDSLAGVLLKRGKTKAALRFCERSLELKRKLGDRFGEAITLGTQGRILLRQARYAEAHDAFAADLEIARELHDRRGIGIMLNSLGEVAWLAGKFAEASQHFQQSIHENDEPINRIFANLGLARVNLAKSDVAAAELAVDQMQELIRTSPHAGPLQTFVDGMRGAIAWRKEDFQQGEVLLKQTIAALCQRSEPLDTIPFLYELRDLYQHQNDLAQGVRVMSQALDLMSQCGAERGVADVEQWLRTVDHPRLTRLALERQLPELLVDQILSGALTLPKPSKQNVTILFSDIRSYTTLTEGLPAEEVVEMLNEWFTEATRAIMQHGGMIDKFIGDAVMALFGVPNEDDNAPANAVRAALEMRDALSAMNLRQEALGKREIRIGIGIHTGPAIIGFMGSHMRHSFTAIGDAVNIASRLESSTKNYAGCDILISDTVEEAQRRYEVAETRFLEAAELKGKNEKVLVFQVLGARG